MKLFVKASLSLNHFVDTHEGFDVTLYGIAVVSENVQETTELLADLVVEQLCPPQLDLLPKVEEFKIITDEQFVLLQELLLVPVFSINGDDIRESDE
jgi:hypothetical protein